MKQPLNGSSEPSQNDCGKTGRACWEHWCLFSSQPLSITWPCGHHHLVCFAASLEQPSHLGSAAQFFWILKPIFMLPLINRDGHECKQAFFDRWHRQHVSRLKLDGLQELDSTPQTTATQLNPTLRTATWIKHFLFLSSKQNIREKAGREQCTKILLKLLLKTWDVVSTTLKLNLKVPF